MVYFSKLKLYGFKSFVDKTEIEIGEGLNGIVGPNGCGKSNLVEALRWVMGEKSAKNMRGGGMEDVIFAGTSKRPARNMAEASILINNSDGTAPAPFNNATEIEITRKIEKDKGSQYRVNGKAVRARDVNLLFADTMTGANSPALVSQGRITEIISAKPQDRRRILEESAGISGLHTRRHEAELRLRAAEQNLTRLDDSLNDIRSRLTSLKRQARQAERYTEINSSIRRVEMALAWSQWRDIRAKIKTERISFDTENTAVQETLLSVKKTTQAIEEQEKSLPSLRKKMMESGAVLQNFKVSLERLEQDIQTKEKGLKDAEDTKQQLSSDIDFAQAQLEQTVQSIDEEKENLKRAQDKISSLPEEIKTLESSCKTLKDSLQSAISEKQNFETQIAVAEKAHQQNEQRHAEYKMRVDQLQSTLSDYNEKIQSLLNDKESLLNDDILNVDLPSLEKQLSSIEDAIEHQTKALVEKEEKHKETQQEEQDLSSALHGLKSEASALSNLVSRTETQNNLDSEDALLNHLKVKTGYEKATSSALGHWASCASIKNDASVYWCDNGATVQTPEGFQPLSSYLTAPPALHPFLSSVGICDSLPSTFPSLRPGQMIVSKDGDIMRWDGLIAGSKANNGTETASLILEQKNRIQELSKIIEEKTTLLDSISTVTTNNDNAMKTLKSELSTLKEQRESVKNDILQTRHQQERIHDRASSIDSALDTYKNQKQQSSIELSDVENNLAEIEKTLQENNDHSVLETKEKIVSLVQHIDQTQSNYDDAQTKLAQIRFENNANEQLIRKTEDSLTRLKSENLSLTQRLETLSVRLDDIVIKITEYQSAQDHEGEDSQRETLLSKISDQETLVQDVSQTLEIAENDYRNLQATLRESESCAATAREKRALAQANIANAEEELKRIESNIAEKFETNPQSLEEQIFSLFGETLPASQDLYNQRDTLTRQRDNIGPVNLRAATECQETETHLADMEREQTDLTKAIEQLRGGISKLNREARDRLAIAFKRVDGHFQKLFSDLFRGGKAYLEMITSDDPLESGLEIYAQPPGKALQKLSLLSGGEQTLTATALIFAMFLTNPSPICVLDEIDAPLDDANVDRICELMEQIARDTQTRFIVITHHRMTMARMDRLYGVTMSERGVSQLVSVDLALQEELALQDKESA